MSGRERSGAEHVAHEISRWEWISAALGALLVFGSIGFMLQDALSRPDTPPRIVISVDTVMEQPPRYLVRLGVRNTGYSTAAALEIEGELVGATGTVQISRTTIDYLPERGSRTAGIFFDHDPRLLTLRLRPVGYDQP